MCKWRSELEEDYRCKVAPEPGSEFCIFHDPGEKDIERFKEEFYKQIGEIGAEDERNPQYDFTGYIFPLFVTFGQGVPTPECVVFPKQLGLKSEEVVFLSATFEKKADFSGATFRGNVSFVGAVFSNITNFLGTTFEGGADFMGARFKEDVLFWATTFKASANFWGTIFLEQADFQRSKAKIMSLGPGNPRLGGFGFGRERCGVILRDTATGYTFWHFARRAFVEQDERQEADAAYYFERIWRLKASVAGPWWRKSLAAFFYFMDLLLLRIPIAYGASTLRPIASWMSVIFCFAAVYATCPTLLARAWSGLWTVSNWVTSLYFSVTVFTTLGLGDVKPARLLGRMLISLEAVMGGLLIALTVVVISRKFMR